MKHTLSLLLLVGLAAFAASCGGKSTSSDATTGSGGTPAATSGQTGGGTTGGGVAAVSKYDGGPRAGESPVNEEKSELGEKLFRSKGCSACHGFGKRLTGPDLQGVSTRRTAA